MDTQSGCVSIEYKRECGEGSVQIEIEMLTDDGGESGGGGDRGSYIFTV